MYRSKALKSMAIDSILNILKSSFREPRHVVRMPYSNAIEVLSTRDTEDTRIWIRLSFIGNTDGMVVDISNIQLDSSIRGKGRFKRLVTSLIRSDYVECVRVSSVMTDIMHKACQGLHMKYKPNISGYELTKADVAMQQAHFEIPVLDPQSVAESMSNPRFNLLGRNGIYPDDVRYNVDTFEALYFSRALQAATVDEIKELLSKANTSRATKKAMNVANILKESGIVEHVRLTRDNSYFTYTIFFDWAGGRLHVHMSTSGKLLRSERDEFNTGDLNYGQLRKIIKNLAGRSSAIYVNAVALEHDLNRLFWEV